MNTFNYKFIDLSFNLSYSFGGYSYDNASYILQDDGYSVISNKKYRATPPLAETG